MVNKEQGGRERKFSSICEQKGNVMHFELKNKRNGEVKKL